MVIGKEKFLIAEAGINHNGSLKKAFKLVDEAKKAGANAIKFQTYITKKRVKKNSPIYSVLKKCELSFDEFTKIKKYADKKKIIFFSTPFDIESVQFLNKLKVKLFKIASFDISNFELIKEIIKTRKPTIISTGMASIIEIQNIIKIFKKKNIKHYLLHCVSSYPTKEEDSFLKNITFLRKKFSIPIGLSDHTNDIKTSIISYCMGARIFEKHFMIKNDKNCVDYPVSLDYVKFMKMKSEMEKIEKILGKVKFGVRKNEKNSKQFKRNKIL